MNNIYNVGTQAVFSPSTLAVPTNQIAAGLELGQIWRTFKVAGFKYNVTYYNNFSAPLMVFVYTPKPLEALPTNIFDIRMGQAQPGWRERIITSNNGGGKTSFKGFKSLKAIYGTKDLDVGQIAYGTMPSAFTGTTAAGTLLYTGGASPTSSTAPILFGSYNLTGGTMNTNSVYCKIAITYYCELSDKNFEVD